MFGEEPRKQKTRSCRTQELARSSAQENERQKKTTDPTHPESSEDSDRCRKVKAEQRPKSCALKRCSAGRTTEPDE